MEPRGCDDARRALIALDTVTASALVKAVAAAKLVDDGKNLLPELAAKRLAADPPSMRALLELLLAAKPKTLAQRLLLVRGQPRGRRPGHVVRPATCGL